MTKTIFLWLLKYKRSLANISAVQPVADVYERYKKDVKEANVRGILCAPRVPDMVKKLLCDYDLEWKEVERQVALPDDWQKTLKRFLEERKRVFKRGRCKVK